MKRTAAKKKSPFELGREAYPGYDAMIALSKAGTPTPNPFPLFSAQWGDWNRGFNSMWMILPAHILEQA